MTETVEDLLFQSHMSIEEVLFYAHIHERDYASAILVIMWN